MQILGGAITRTSMYIYIVSLANLFFFKFGVQRMSRQLAGGKVYPLTPPPWSA